MFLRYSQQVGLWPCFRSPKCTRFGTEVKYRIRRGGSLDLIHLRPEFPTNASPLTALAVGLTILPVSRRAFQAVGCSDALALTRLRKPPDEASRTPDKATTFEERFITRLSTKEQSPARSCS